MSALDLNAELYDLYVDDWPGEMDFYRSAAERAHARGETLLEIACGTGRVVIRLAKMGVQVTGLDHSPAMLEIARSKSSQMTSVRWVQADMRDFALGERHGLVIIPGHAFQHMLTADDQLASLACIHRHLAPGGTLIVHLDHQNLDWLGEIGQHPFMEVRNGNKLVHPVTGQIYRRSYSWAYERATQTAICQNTWEVLDAEESVLEHYDNDPVRLHCVFRQEMEHLARRAGFEINAVYGDFSRNDLQENSEEMIWVLERPGINHKKE